MPFVGVIAARLIGAKLPAGLARFLAWTIVIVAAALLVWGGWSLLKSSIITTHSAKVEAGQAKAQLDRQGEADQDAAPRVATDAAAQDQLDQEIDNAILANPDGARRPVGPATGAALDELRRQGEAGAGER